MLNSFEKTILEIENYCNKNNLDHRFVGGSSFGGLLNKKTTWKINIKNREVILTNNNKLTSLRKDKTLKDIDLIIFEKNKNKLKSLKKIYNKKSNKKSRLSLENAVYFPNKINSLLQFVTTIYIDKDNEYYLQFGNIKEKILKKSLEAWTVILNDKLKYSVRNPIADYFAYQFRSPGGIKEKDKNKLILLKKLSDDVIKNGRKNNIDFLLDQYYNSWFNFIQKLQTSNDYNIRIKRTLMKIYWKTIGEYLAHGKGITKYFQFLSDKFTG